MKLEQNTILVTGGTSGIGRALAEAFHLRQNKVIISGRRQQQLDEITKLNPGMIGLRLDVTDRKSIEGFADEVRQRFPELNVLINNAGISRSEDYAAQQVDVMTAMTILQTNVASVIQLTAALLPVLEAQPHATLMATSSGTAFVPMAAYPTYCASKAFVHSWLEAIRFQLRETSVEVLELVPPYVQTQLGGTRQASDPRAMPLPAFIAEVLKIIEEGTHEHGEILVENVLPLRWAEKDGQYQHLLTALGTS